MLKYYASNVRTTTLLLVGRTQDEHCFHVKAKFGSRGDSFFISFDEMNQEVNDCFSKRDNLQENR